MWAHIPDYAILHIWRHMDGKLISVCGLTGENPLSYTETKLPKCEKWIALLPKYKEKQLWVIQKPNVRKQFASLRKPLVRNGNHTSRSLLKNA